MTLKTCPFLNLAAPNSPHVLHSLQTGPALSRCNRCGCIGHRASEVPRLWGPAPCVWIVVHFAKYSLRSNSVEAAYNI